MLLGLDGWRSRERLKISILEFPDTQKTELWKRLGGIFEGFGEFGMVSVCPGCVWNAFWMRLGASGVLLGSVL